MDARHKGATRMFLMISGATKSRKSDRSLASFLKRVKDIENGFLALNILSRFEGIVVSLEERDDDQVVVDKSNEELMFHIAAPLKNISEMKFSALVDAVHSALFQYNFEETDRERIDALFSKFKQDV